MGRSAVAEDVEEREAVVFTSVGDVRTYSPYSKKGANL